MLFLLQPFCSSGNIFSFSKKMYKCSEITPVKTFHINGRQETGRYLSTALPLVLFFGIKPFAHESANQAIVDFHSNHIQLKSSSFMQVCQFLNPEALNSISSWSFPIRDFPTLLTNHLLSNNQPPMLLIIIFFLQFF